MPAEHQGEVRRRSILDNSVRALRLAEASGDEIHGEDADLARDARPALRNADFSARLLAFAKQL
jgi:hypothetical protein